MNHIYYFFSSLFFFIFHLFYKKSYDIIFYSPIHFNRGRKRENIYLKSLFSLCDRNQISYLYFEEPNYSLSYKRSSNAKPFDFIFIIVILLRKFMFNSEMSIIIKDHKIGSFLKQTFLRGISASNYITISQSFLSVFRGLDCHANIFDVQHGIIYADKLSYVNDSVPADNIIKNNAKLLLNGDMYKTILENADGTSYYYNHAFSLGYSLFPYLKKHEDVNKKVVVSLQFTSDHTEEENQKMYMLLVSFFSKHKEFTFYLRIHPRTIDHIYHNQLTKNDNVFLSSNNLFDDFSECSFHLTFYSTTTFDAALCGIPTCFLNLENENLFYSDFDYPLGNNLSLLDCFHNYSIYSDKVRKWAYLYYKNIDEKLFISVLKK